MYTLLNTLLNLEAILEEAVRFMDSADINLPIPRSLQNFSRYSANIPISFMIPLLSSNDHLLKHNSFFSLNSLAFNFMAFVDGYHSLSINSASIATVNAVTSFLCRFSESSVCLGIYDAGEKSAKYDAGALNLIRFLLLSNIHRFRYKNPMVSFHSDDMLNQILINYWVGIKMQEDKSLSYEQAFDSSCDYLGWIPGIYNMHYKKIFKKILPIYNHNLSTYDIWNILQTYGEIKLNIQTLTSYQASRLLGTDFTFLSILNPVVNLTFFHLVKNSLVNFFDSRSKIKNLLESIESIKKEGLGPILRKYYRVSELIPSLAKSVTKFDLKELMDKSARRTRYKNRYIDKISKYLDKNSEESGIFSLTSSFVSHTKELKNNLKLAEYEIIREFELYSMNKHKEMYENAFQDVLESIIENIDEDEITQIYVEEERKVIHKLKTTTGANLVIDEYCPVTIFSSFIDNEDYWKTTVHYLHKVKRNYITVTEFAYSENVMRSVFDIFNIWQLTEAVSFEINQMIARWTLDSRTMFSSSMALTALNYYSKVDSFIPNRLYKLLPHGASFDLAYSYMGYSRYSGDVLGSIDRGRFNFFTYCTGLDSFQCVIGRYLGITNCLALQGINTFSYTDKPLLLILNGFIIKNLFSDYFNYPTSYIKSVLTNIPESTINFRRYKKNSLFNLSLTYDIRKIFGVDYQEEEDTFLNILNFPNLATKQSFALFREVNSPKYSYHGLGAQGYLATDENMTKYDTRLSFHPGVYLRSVNFHNLYNPVTYGMGIFSFFSYNNLIKPDGSAIQVNYFPTLVSLTIGKQLGEDIYFAFNYGSSILGRILDVDINFDLLNDERNKDNLYLINPKKLLYSIAKSINVLYNFHDIDNMMYLSLDTWIKDDNYKSFVKNICCRHSISGFLSDFVYEMSFGLPLPTYLGNIYKNSFYTVDLIGFILKVATPIVSYLSLCRYEKISQKRLDYVDIKKIKPWRLFWLEKRINAFVDNDNIYASKLNSKYLSLMLKDKWISLNLADDFKYSFLSKIIANKNSTRDTNILMDYVLKLLLMLNSLSVAEDVMYSSGSIYNNSPIISIYLTNELGYTRRDFGQVLCKYTNNTSIVASTAMLFRKVLYGSLTLADEKVPILINNKEILLPYYFKQGLIKIISPAPLITSVKFVIKSSVPAAKSALKTVKNIIYKLLLLKFFKKHSDEEKREILRKIVRKGQLHKKEEERLEKLTK